MLLITLGMVVSSLLAAQYAARSSWWLSVLALSICLLGFCTWMQLAATRANRWPSLIARQYAARRAQQLAELQQQCALECTIAHISGNMSPMQFPQTGVRHPHPPPSYGAVTSTLQPPPDGTARVSTPAINANTDVNSPPPAEAQLDTAAHISEEPPPPYCVAIRRDTLVQAAETTHPENEVPGQPSPPPPTQPNFSPTTQNMSHT